MADITLSIITVAYNCENALKKTIDSVKRNIPSTYWENIEYIIVDGKSMDHTVETAKDELSLFRQEGGNVLIHSAKDSGIYNAMNKGLKMAKGIWVYMLNAGDTINEEISFDVLFSLLKVTDADVIYGKTRRVNPCFSEIWQPGPLSDIEKGMIFCHQSVFLRRNLQEHYYNERFKYCADYDMILRMYLANYNFQYIDQVISDYDLGGITATKAVTNAHQEIHAIRKAHDRITTPVKDAVRYYAGIVKCWVLSGLPEDMRWMCTKYARKIKAKNHY